MESKSVARHKKSIAELPLLLLLSTFMYIEQTHTLAHTYRHTHTQSDTEPPFRDTCVESFRAC